MYAHFLKRVFDLFLSFLAIIILSPLLLLLTIVGAIAMKGNPFFVQPRPGKKDKNGQERIFKLIKFRTMTREKDKLGKLFPDEKRLNEYGRFLRKTSLDELPELFNIFIGDMAIVGPRPLLVEYLPWYTEIERKRHNVRPGLTGLAQINGRNLVPWDERLKYDVAYVDSISLINDIQIIFTTIGIVFSKKGVANDTEKVEGNLAEIRSSSSSNKKKTHF
jgi:lipopolysaccharide/colanic/teichoic acid biosynthesis glycosyltransferase